MKDRLSDKAKARIESLRLRAAALPNGPFVIGNHTRGTDAKRAAENFLEYAENAREGRFFESCLYNVEKICETLKIY